jgi:hypothetical protein
MALIAIAADKGSPGVTTTAVALAAVWPRPVLLAECDPAGGDLVYRLPGGDGQRLDARRGLLSLAVAARRGLQPHQVWEHVQKLRGGLDVLTGVTSAEQGAGLEALWGSVGAVLAALPQADVIADCGRIGVDGPYYDFIAHAAVVVMITRATLGEVVRMRERTAAVAAAVHRRGRPGARAAVVVIADHRHFTSALAEVAQSLDQGGAPAAVLGGLADEPKSADLLRGEWGGKLDKSLLIRTARQIAAHLAGQLPAAADPGPAPDAVSTGRPPDRPAGLDSERRIAEDARQARRPSPAPPPGGLEILGGRTALDAPRMPGAVDAPVPAPSRPLAPPPGGLEILTSRAAQPATPAQAGTASAGPGPAEPGQAWQRSPAAPGYPPPAAGQPLDGRPAVRRDTAGPAQRAGYRPADWPDWAGPDHDGQTDPALSRTGRPGRQGRDEQASPGQPYRPDTDWADWADHGQGTGPMAAQQDGGRRAQRGRHSGAPGTDGDA